jgi:hypothetical protein
MSKTSKEIFIEQRLLEIEKEVEEQRRLLGEKEKSWDYGKEFTADNYQRFTTFTAPERKRLAELSREERMIMPYELSELPKYGDVMSLKEFIECVKEGGFIDYDGYGHYVKDGKETNIIIHPSDIGYKAVRKEFDTIVWYNR